MDQKQPWKYCVIGNIVKTHLDEDGMIRSGTKPYAAGKKVYLCGRCWPKDEQEIEVIGLNRYHRFAVNSIPVSCIENVRLGRCYKPKVLEIMDDWECRDLWWGNTSEERESAQQFVENWNQRQ